MRGLTLTAVLLALAACGGAREVHLSIRAADALTAEQLAQIETLEIAVLGAEPGAQRYTVGKLLLDRSTTWLYRSKIEGPLRFQVVARGAERRLIAAGASPIVTTGSSAVDASVVLGQDTLPVTKHRLGQSCTAGVDVCESGFCVDGLCCDSACEGACNSCNGVTPGHCAPATAGTNPRSLCKLDPQKPCGLDGSCDGAGACRLAGKGTSCAAPSCSAGVLTLAATCDGAGVCGTPATRACLPYACNPQNTACATICTPSVGCAPLVSCVSGRCGKVEQGARCLAGADCLNGTCVDGFCCDSTCTGACRSCKEPGHEGSCSDTAPGAIDPRGLCVDQGVSSCGTSGRCDGAAGCQRYPAGTPCAASACSADATAFIATRVCAGDGSACPAEAPQACGPYRCVTDGSPGCAASCGECTYFDPDMGPPFPTSCADGASCQDHCLADEARFVCQ